ncbi:hypothetical protein [Timonella sp. A28]|uniref:hypothetical protein n=1 Tax=Timonella sp. A28 TaxID=3442640 RepID=UPI003EB9AD98
MNSSTGPLPRHFRSAHNGAILPRAASLAAWLPAVSSGLSDPETAAASIQFDDEPHHVITDESTLPLSHYLRNTIGHLLACCAVFPIPGDVSSAPLFAASHGVEAEEMVLLRVRNKQGAHNSYALVPTITEFGSHNDRGYLVQWRCYETTPWEYQVLASAGSLADAHKNLRSTLIEATESLLRLDVASWVRDYPDFIDLLRDPVDVSGFLPPSLSPRAYQVLELASRLRAIVDIAHTSLDNTHTNDQRLERQRILHSIDANSRRAMEAATLVSPLLDMSL